MLREIEGGGATDSVLQNTPVLATQDSESKEGGEATESVATGGGGGDGEEGGGSTVMTQAQKKAAKKEREKKKKEAARQAKLAQQSKQERTADNSGDSGATAEEKTMATADKDTMDDEQVRNNEYCIARNIGRNYLAQNWYCYCTVFFGRSEFGLSSSELPCVCENEILPNFHLVDKLIDTFSGYSMAE